MPRREFNLEALANLTDWIYAFLIFVGGIGAIGSTLTGIVLAIIAADPGRSGITAWHALFCAWGGSLGMLMALAAVTLFKRTNN